MAAGGFLDMSKFTFVGKVIEAVSEMIMEDTLQGQELNALHTIFTNIVSKQEVGFIGEGAMVGKADSGCSPKSHDWEISTRKVVWEPETWEISPQQCYKDLESAATVYSMRTGISIPDFTDTDYMNIVLEVLKKSVNNFWYRLFWFNDKDAKTFTEGGNITDTVDVDYMNIITGFWAQIFDQVSENSDQRVEVSENSGSTYADQKLDPSKVQDYLSNLVGQADIMLRQMDDRFILVTQTFFDAYARSLMDSNSLESARMALIDGLDTLRFNGIPVIAMPIWDKMINTCNNSGSAWLYPHRALFTSKSVLGIGVDDIERMGGFNIWYNPDEKVVKIHGMGRADAKLLNPEMFVVAA